MQPHKNGPTSSEEKFCISLQKKKKNKPHTRPLQPPQNPYKTLAKPLQNPYKTPYKTLTKPLQNPYRSQYKTPTEPVQNPYKTSYKTPTDPNTKPLQNPYKNPTKPLQNPYKTPTKPPYKFQKRCKNSGLKVFVVALSFPLFWRRRQKKT